MWWMAVAWADVPTFDAQRATLQAALPDRQVALAAVGADADGRFSASHGFTDPDGITLDEAMTCTVTTWEPLLLACSLGFAGSWNARSELVHAEVEGQRLVFEPMPESATGALTLSQALQEKSVVLTRWLDQARPWDETGGATAAPIGRPPPPPPSPAVLVEGSGSVAPEEHHEVVASVLSRHAGQLRYCYESTLRSIPDHEGVYRVVLGIDAGRVTHPVGVTGDNQDLADCIHRRATIWRFPTSVTGEVRWAWTLQLKD
jgi:hypothetical protein